MSINSDFKETNSPGASITMQHYIFAFVQNLINQPENPERSKDWLRSYCEKEKMSYSELEYNLNVFFQLLEEYHKTNTFILYRFLRLQAQACFIDEDRFDLLRIDLPQQELPVEILESVTCSCGDNTISSSLNGGIVGGHLIGL